MFLGFVNTFLKNAFKYLFEIFLQLNTLHSFCILIERAHISKCNTILLRFHILTFTLPTSDKAFSKSCHLVNFHSIFFLNRRQFTSKRFQLFVINGQFWIQNHAGDISGCSGVTRVPNFENVIVVSESDLSLYFRPNMHVLNTNQHNRSSQKLSLN